MTDAVRRLVDVTKNRKWQEGIKGALGVNPTVQAMLIDIAYAAVEALPELEAMLNQSDTLAATQDVNRQLAEAGKNAKEVLDEVKYYNCGSAPKNNAHKAACDLHSALSAHAALKEVSNV